MKLDLTKLPVGEMITTFLVAALVVTFIGAFTATNGGGGGQGGEGPAKLTPVPGGIDISMGDNFFEPKEYEVPAGAAVTFNITNKGILIHNVRIAGADGDYGSGDDAVSDAPGGGDMTILTWTAPSSPGVINFRCDFHAPGMAGTITVK